MPTRRTSLILSACALLLAPAESVGAAEPSTTEIQQAYAIPGNAGYNIIATLDPAHPESELKFTMYKKKDGRWVKVASRSIAQTAEDSGKGVYYATGSFKTVKAKRCKVTAKFAGDEDHAVSKDSQRLACKA